MPAILLIDDDPQILCLIGPCLEKAGYQVNIAKDGNQGLKLIEAQEFDLIITDIIMPEQDGFGVINRLISDPKRPRIIAMSGGSSALGQDYILRMAKQLQVDKVLAKPVSMQELLSTVDELIGGRT